MASVFKSGQTSSELGCADEDDLQRQSNELNPEEMIFDGISNSQQNIQSGPSDIKGENSGSNVPSPNSPSMTTLNQFIKEEMAKMNSQKVVKQVNLNELKELHKEHYKQQIKSENEGS